MTEPRKLTFESLDALRAELRRLLDEGYRPIRKWSLSQMCEHLSLFFSGAVDGMGKPLPWIVRATVGKWMLGRILAGKVDKEGVSVPEKWLPGESGDDVAAVEKLIEAIDRFEAHSGEYQPSPFFGQMSREQWLGLQLFHAAHHLRFLDTP